MLRESASPAQVTNSLLDPLTIQPASDDIAAETTSAIPTPNTTATMTVDTLAQKGKRYIWIPIRIFRLFQSSKLDGCHAHKRAVQINYLAHLTITTSPLARRIVIRISSSTLVFSSGPPRAGADSGIWGTTSALSRIPTVC